MPENFKYRPGIGSTGAYQISGIPYLTGSTLTGGAENELSLPAVSRAITIYNTGGSNSLRVHFDTDDNANVLGNKHFIEVPGATTGGLNRIRIEVRCSKVYISSASGTSYQMLAELTPIADKISLSGSGINE
tara:strand:+ start:438 stop:833 length:396 start_codon:yes stop_codon:yes gene_type:complete